MTSIKSLFRACIPAQTAGSAAPDAPADRAAQNRLTGGPVTHAPAYGPGTPVPRRTAPDRLAAQLLPPTRPAAAATPAATAAEGPSNAGPTAPSPATVQPLPRLSQPPRARGSERFAAWIGKRPTNTGAKLFGIGSSSTRDGTVSLTSKVVTSDPTLDVAQALIDRGHRLAERVRQLLDGTLEDLPDTQNRPQRSRLMKLLARLPGGRAFKPRKLSELVAQDPAYATPEAPRQGRTRRPRAGQDKRPELAQRLQRLVRAVKAQADAEQAYVAACAGHGSTAASGQEPGRPTPEEALQALRDATQHLHVQMCINTLLDTGADALTADAIAQKIDFVHSEIAHLQQRLRQTSLGLDEVRDCLLKQGESLRHTRDLAALRADASSARYCSTAHDFHVAEKELTLAQAALRDFLSAAKAAGGPAPSDTESLATFEQQRADAGEPTLAVLETAVDELRNAVREAADIANRHADQLADARHALAEFEPYLQQELEQLKAQADGVQAELAALRGPGEQVRQKASAWATQQQQTRAAVDEIHALGAAALAAVPPGFAPEQLATEKGRQLSFLMGELARAIPADDPEAERTLPRIAVIELLSRALAGVCGGDAGAAVRLLAQLMSHPPQHWIAPPAAPEGSAGDTPTAVHAPPSAAMVELFRLMASVPRGIEVLNLAGARGAQPTLDSEALDTVQAYWLADAAAAAAGTPPGVSDWLHSAMDAARHELHPGTGGAPATPPTTVAAHAALNAVKHGFLSNAPGSDYDEVNKLLLKVSGDWIRAAEDKRTRLLKWLPRTLAPGGHRSPYHPKALQLARRLMERQGMSTTKTLAHRSISGAAKALAALAAAGLFCGVPGQAHSADARLMDATLEVVCQLIASHAGRPTLGSRVTGRWKKPSFQHTKRLYDACLDARDIADIRRAVARALQQPGTEAPPSGPARLRKPNPHPDVRLPEPFETLFSAPDVRVVDVLKALHRHLAADVRLMAHLGPQGLAALDDFADDGTGNAPIDAKVLEARRKVFETEDDVLAFLTTMLQSLHIRDQLNITSGSALGAGIPLLPWSPMPPILAGLSLNLLTRRREAVLQVKSPTFAIETQIGEAVGRTHGVSGMLGLGMGAGAAKLALPALTGRWEGGHQTTTFATLRTLRKKNHLGVRDEPAAIDKHIAMMCTLLRWNADELQPNDRPFGGPLEALLALHSDAQIGWGRKYNVTHQTGLGLRLFVRGGGGGEDGIFSAGAYVEPLSLKVESNQEHSTEQNGPAHQTVRDRSDQRRQRVIAALGLTGVLKLLKQPVDPKPTEQGDNADPNAAQQGDEREGNWRVMGPLNLVDVSRELAHHFEKTGAVRFCIGDKTGGSYDRTYGTAADLLAEIRQHREEFLLRCLETLPRAKDAPMDTPEARQHAEELLANFEANLAACMKNPNLQYNIKYEMQPKLSGMIDGLRALEVLFTRFGDSESATNARRTMNGLLDHRAAQSPKNMAVRNKIKDSTESGIDFVLRWLLGHQVETTTSPASYPV